MISREYWKGDTSLESSWTFTNTTKQSNYDPIIKTSTAELTKSQREALWELQRVEHEVYLRIEDVWKYK